MTTNVASHFNWVDYTIIGIIAFSIIISFFRGFLREAVSLVVWIAGVLLALKFATPVQVHLQAWIASATIRYIIAFVALFLVVFIVGALLNALLHAVVSKTGLSATDRLLGIFFGGVRGLLIIAILLMFVSVGNVKDGTALAQSRLAPEFKPIVVWLNGFLPMQIKQLSQWVRNGNVGNNAGIKKIPMGNTGM